MEILMTVAGNAAQQVVDYTLAPSARQVGYLIFYKGNFKDLEDQVKELNRVKESIENKVKEERRNGREIGDIVQNWLNRVDGITKAAKQLSDDPRRNNAGCSKWSCPNLKSRHQLSRKAKKMATNVVEVMQEKPLNVVGYLPPLDVVGSTSATSSEKLESRNLMKQEIVLALRDPKISRIGVYGLGGVGKTTLVKEVAKQVKDNKLFDEVVIVNISEDLDLGKIQDELADFLGLHFQEKSIVGKASRLCQRIKQERSILIVLDNVQPFLDLEKLGIPLENVHEGCKLLLTSRNQDTLEKMEIHKDFGLNVLNPKESWSLFEEMVGDALKDASLRSIAVQVAKKCAGLTVLIVTVAKALKSKKDIKSWEDALKQLQTVDKHGMTEKIYSALEFSYNHLEDDEVKALFLLCGVLGESVDFILKYVMGLGIMKNINTVNDARLRLHKLLGSLEASFLLLEVNTDGKVKMHDTIREVAVSIASRDKRVFKIGRGAELKKWPTENLLRGCRQIILEWCHIHKLPARLDCPNVEFFYLCNVNNSLDVPDSFFEGMRNLKVLDLTRMHLTSLPNSFDSLIDLKTLCLDQCVLGDLTKIGALKNLQALSLYRSSIIRLPSELGQLTLLRMLDLTSSGIEIFPSNIISKLTNLEELYVGNTFIKWELENFIAENKTATLSELKYLTKLTALEIQIHGALVLPRDIMFENLERYKIVIGDVWEWSNSYGASKMLKLKLHTSIHLEHGIKELIQGVEDLYLDEINGISNVLYHLNGEGFPLLKHLHIQNNVQIQHIIDSRERNQSDHAFFPKLETLVLQNLGNLEKICDGSLTINSFAKLRSIKVKCCDQLKYLFSFVMVKALSQLVEIEVLECNSMKKIVFVESPSPNSGTIDDNIEFYSLLSLTLRHLPAVDVFCIDESTSSVTTKQDLLGTNVFPTSFFNAKVKFSNLETLKLSSIKLNKIWDDDQLSIADSFHNLANLSVEDCSGLKYLFTSSMIGSFLKLKQLEINKCDMMKEIISVGGENGATKEVRLSKLETMVINNMKSLKKVWHFQFDVLKTLEVNNCEKLENIFPSDMQRTFGSLETLKVSDCGSMEEIFQLTANEILSQEEDNVTQVTQLKKLHLLRLPNLKQIWSKDPQGIIRFCHLQDVKVENCTKLEYLFPFSIAMDLLQLEKLFMNECDGMKKIAAMKEGPIGEKAIFNFQQLHSLVIWNMDELDGFYAENHILACPSLRVLRVFECAKLELFEIRGRGIQRKNLPISMQQPLFIVEEVIQTLENLILSSKDATMICQDQQWMGHFRKLKVLALYNFTDKQSSTFVDSILQKAPNLATLIVQDSSLKEIFQDGRLARKEGKNEKGTQLRKLILSRLEDLRYICRAGCQIDPILEVLEVLTVTQCDILKILVPSSVIFSLLTYLEIGKCNALINLIYSSTARSLVKLESMKIKECDSLEEIVIQEVAETQDEIGFNSLETLELECLRRLSSFSSSKCLFKFPLLKRVVVRECPRMKIFCARETSTPMLRKVIKGGKDEEWCWEGDLNRTVNKIFQDKVAFRSFNHLELSEYPELEELWYGQVGQNIFCNVKHVVVHKCTFLSSILFSSNLLQFLYVLEEIEVTECDSLEAVFDVKVLDVKVMDSKEVSRLKKLTLSGLPNLKHIWNEEPREIVSFGNLQAVEVAECHHLKNLFSVSLCQDLRQLEELYIDSCGVEEIVSIEEGSVDLKFDFPLLTKLRLFNLTQLTDFYPKRHTLECPSLKILNVGQCESLQIFAFDHLDSQKLRACDADLQNQPALFYIEKVSQNLEELSLNGKDAMRILNGNYERNLFHRIEVLRLQYFQETPIIFLNDLMKRFPSTTTFQVRWSSFKTLFPSKEIGHCTIENPTQIKNMWLYQLEQLEHIWYDEYSVSDPLVQNLEYLSVSDCSRLIRLAPPSTSFLNLTTLQVSDCNGLTYLMTCFTAKSLIQLTSLGVEICGMMEEIVMTEEAELEEEIIFESLKHLELISLSSLKSFCSGKHTFIFPSLVSLEVKGCHQMQNFSSGVTITPFLSIVEVDDGKKRWKENVNTTIKQLFTDKEIRGDEGNYKESSGNIIESSQTNQRTVSTTKASSFEEQLGQSKPDQIADTAKQEMHKLPSLSYHKEQNKQVWSGTDRPLAQVTQNASIPSTSQHTGSSITELLEESQNSETRSGKNSFKQAAIVNNEETVRTEEMYETVERPLVQAAKIALSPTTFNDAVDGSQDTEIHPCENLPIHTTTYLIDDNKEKTQEMNKVIEKPLIQPTHNTLSLTTNQDAATGTQEIDVTMDRPLSQAAQNALKSSIAPDIEESPDSETYPSQNLFSQTTSSIIVDKNETIGTQEMHETVEKPLTQIYQDVVSLATAQNTGMNETIVEPLIQTAQKAHSPSAVQDTGIDAQKMCEIPETSLYQASQNTLSLTKVDAAMATQEMHANIERPLVQGTEIVVSATTIYGAAIVLSPSQALEDKTSSIHDKATGAKETYETIDKPFVQATQNAWSPTTVHDKAFDPTPSQSLQAISSSTTVVADAYNSFKEMMDDSIQFKSYLEFGMKRHPQVLNWFNTKQRRVFAFLFAEVTRILRTTRRCDLTEDDQNYIRECCIALEAVGFDDSWLSYLSGCIEECGDGEVLKRKLEEAEGKASILQAELEEVESKASNLKKELASAQGSIALLRDKASRLDSFIES